MDTYRLLRNNNESGPFTKEQLTALGLKPYDLVWVENRSAAWRYPEEVPELKAFAATTPLNTTFSVSSEIPKTKPRFKITATSQKIDVQKNAEVPAVSKERTYTRHTSSLAWFNEHLNKSMPVSAEPVLETKYQDSLEDIKKRYEASILKPAEKKRSYLRYAWLLAIPVLALSAWGGYHLSTDIKEGNFVAKVKQASTGFTHAVQKTTIEVPENNYQRAESNQLIIEPGKISKQDLTEEPTIKTNDKKQVPKTEVAADQNKTIETKTFSTAETVSKEKERTPEIIKADLPGKTVAVATTPVPSKPVAGKSRRTSDYVVVDGDYNKSGNVIQNLSLKVENVSPYPIDLVVLDIQYFDKNGRLQKGETVYAKNIASRRDVVVNAPTGSNAYSVGYKVSLISAEKAGVYLVAD
jgi:hypothetical protein